MKSRLILIGGFLGAGKTTLIREVAQRFAKQNAKVGLITNDQAPELVDTAILSQGDQRVAEVNGSCFCCNFPGLISSIETLRTEANADVLIAEPVGSCTDLSATIVQPLKALHNDDIDVAPLSVVVDATRLGDVLDGAAELHPSAAYIYRKQLEEADVILINKSDLVDVDHLAILVDRIAVSYPLAKVFPISAITGTGIGNWIKFVTSSRKVGQQLAEVDYDTYAEGEAVLGWLNATFTITGPETDWRSLAENLLRRLGQRFDALSAPVGHVKLILESGNDHVVGNLTGRVNTLNIRGALPGGQEAKLTLNARVEMSPKDLDRIVREEVALIDAHLTMRAWQCFSPGRPNPSFRYTHLVSLA